MYVYIYVCFVFSFECEATPKPSPSWAYCPSWMPWSHDTCDTLPLLFGAEPKSMPSLSVRFQSSGCRNDPRFASAQYSQRPSWLPKQHGKPPLDPFVPSIRIRSKLGTMIASPGSGTCMSWVVPLIFPWTTGKKGLILQQMSGATAPAQAAHIRHPILQLEADPGICSRCPKQKNYGFPSCGGNILTQKTTITHSANPCFRVQSHIVNG